MNWFYYNSNKRLILIRNYKIHTKFVLYMVSGTRKQIYNPARMQHKLAQPNTIVYPYARKTIGPINIPIITPINIKASIQANCHALSSSFDMSEI